MSESEELRIIPTPTEEEVGRRLPSCSWCGRPVAQWGDTCDEACFNAWVKHFLPWREGQTFVSKGVQYRPNPREEQPWV